MGGPPKTTTAVHASASEMIAITRAPSAQLARCELSFVGRQPVDLELARAQHQAYNRALSAAGCRVIQLPAINELADAVFVEDVALVLDEQAIITRPGAVSRRPESATVATALEAFRSLARIDPPGTLDGGDILRIGRQIYVGRSERSNLAAIEQLRDLVSGNGYRVTAVPIRDCLHLKSAVTAVSAESVLINPAWVDAAIFADYRQILVEPGEAHAANALLVGNSVIYPDCFPATAAKLISAGVKLLLVDVSELQKVEGAVTCCSLVFSTG